MKELTINWPEALSKALVKEKAAKIAAELEPNQLAALAIFLEQLAKQLKEVAKSSNSLTREELDKMGIKLSSHTTYDYRNSPAWTFLQNKLKSVLEPVKNEISHVENVAKSLAKGWEKLGHDNSPVSVWIDADTGEFFEIKPAIRSDSPKFEIVK